MSSSRLLKNNSLHSTFINVSDPALPSPLADRTGLRPANALTCHARGWTLLIFRVAPRHYDVVVTDLTMPNLRGDMLAVELLRIRPDIPVILCTGIRNTETRERAQQVGIRVSLLKPVEIRDLNMTIRHVLNLPQDPKLLTTTEL